MRILITNDDGIDAVGIKVLAEFFCKDYDVLVVAPSTQKSACSHSLSIHNEIIYRQVIREGYTAFSVDGTPADCTKLALLHLSNKKIDIVISGINNGSNLGTDTMYSGTVAAAKEAAFHGVKAMALSLTTWDADEEKYVAAAKFFSENFLAFASVNISTKSILNINFPVTSPFKGVKATKIGVNVYDDSFIESETIGAVRLQGRPVEYVHNEPDSDVEWVKKGYITVSPLTLDNNDYSSLITLKESLKDFKIK